MEKIFEETLFKIGAKLQQFIIETFSHVKSIVVMTNSEESTESEKAFYFFSLMLLISLIFLAPDKIPQTFVTTRADIGIFEKVKEIIERLMPNFG